MSVKRIDYKGEQVIYADYRGLTQAEQQIRTLEELVALLTSASTPQLILSNYEGISIGPEYMKRAKELGKTYELKIKRQAALPLTGLKQILFDGYVAFTQAKNIKGFQREDEALEWLVS